VLFAACGSDVLELDVRKVGVALSFVSQEFVSYYEYASHHCIADVLC